MSIQILPPQLANQIAAGEVVERPSSVVKELVENALDAGASQVDIEIEKGGHKRILIRDNGKGIAKEQLGLALSRHATSKIKSLDDLEAIGSLGFRGEALASISSVSRLTMTSKPAEQSEAWAANAEGLDMDVVIKPAAHPNGTTVDVVDLFFNTPARRKFLRAEKTEFNHIDILIKRIALSRPDVTFVLKHNKKVVKRYRGQATELGEIEQISNRIAEVVNPAFVELAAVNQLTYDNVKMSVWVKQPDYCVAVNPAQYSFVNGRMMRDKLLQHAIRQAFADLLGPEQQPEYVVFIELPASEVDVNVHPAKHEVRFHHARLLHDLLVRVINDALVAQQQSLLPQQADDAASENEINEQPQWVVTPADNYQQAARDTQIEKFDLTERHQPAANQQSSQYQPQQQQQKQKQGSYAGLKPSYQSRGVTGAQRSAFDAYLSAASDEPKVESTFSPEPQKHNQPFQVVLVETSGYVFVKLNNDLFLLPPEAFSSESKSQSQLSFEPTPLLVPIRIKLETSEKEWLEQHKVVFVGIGFQFTLHGSSMIIKQVPNCLRQGDKSLLLPELIGQLMTQTEIDVDILKQALVGQTFNQKQPDEIEAKLQSLVSANQLSSFFEKYAIPLKGKAIFQQFQK